MEYFSGVWSYCYNSRVDMIVRVRTKWLRIVALKCRYLRKKYHYNVIYMELIITTLQQRRYIADLSHIFLS